MPHSPPSTPSLLSNQTTGPVIMKMFQKLITSRTFLWFETALLLLLTFESTLAYIAPTDIYSLDSPICDPIQERIPPNCNDGGLNVTMSLSVDILNPLNYLDLAGAPLNPHTINNIIATVDIHKTNPYSVTFCPWNMPLDKYANSTGIYRLYNGRGCSEIPLEYTGLSRIWTDWESLLEKIPGGGTTQMTHTLRLITSALRELVDGKYLVRVEGHWWPEEQGYQNCFMSPVVEVEVSRQQQLVR